MADKRRAERAKKDQKKAKTDSRAGTMVRFRGKQADLMHAQRRGELDVSDWDIEELLRGYRRAKNGRFVGRPPQVVPREVHDELAKRVKSEVAHELRGLAQKHIKPVYEMIVAAHEKGGLDPEQVPGMRLQLEAAKDLMDRFIVGRNEKVEISGTLKHETIIDQVTIDRTLDEEDIVDAEVVEEEDIDIDEELEEWED